MFTSTSFSNEAYTAFDTSLFRDAICTDCRILQRRMRGDRKFPTTVSLTCMSLFSPYPHVYSSGSPSGFVGITCGHRRGERPYADRWCLTFVDKAPSLAFGAFLCSSLFSYSSTGGIGANESFFHDHSIAVRRRKRIMRLHLKPPNGHKTSPDVTFGTEATLEVTCRLVALTRTVGPKTHPLDRRRNVPTILQPQ